MYHGDFGVGVGDGAAAIFEEFGSVFGVDGLWLHPAHNSMRIRIQDDTFLITFLRPRLEHRSVAQFFGIANFFVAGCHTTIEVSSLCAAKRQIRTLHLLIEALHEIRNKA